jgi:hypothetical protein
MTANRTHTPEWTYTCQYFWVRLATKFLKGRKLI